MTHKTGRAVVLTGVIVLFGAGAALAQDGSFFTNDYFIEEDVMIEGAFDSGSVVETYDEAVEEDEAVSDDAARQEDDPDFSAEQ